MNVVLFAALKGGFFLRKKSLGGEVSVYSNSESAIGAGSPRHDATIRVCARPPDVGLRVGHWSRRKHIDGQRHHIRRHVWPEKALVRRWTIVIRQLCL